MKKLLSLLLVFVMMFSLLPMSALAEEEDVQTETEQSLETEGSVGTLLGNTLDGAALDDDASLCSVTDIRVEGTTATVEYQTDRASELVVAVYEEESMKMLGSGHAVVTADADTAEVEITIDAMPDHFIVSAYLLDADTLDPLGDAYTSSYYTEAVSDLRQKTAEDFDENLVLLLEDGNTETNFLVFGEGTLLAEAGDSSNQITDNGDGTYTIVNADESFLALTAGDSFSYTYADGTVLVVVAKSVVVNGSTVTVTADTDAELEDVFDYVKIEATSDGANASARASNEVVYDDSTKDEDIEFNGIEGAYDGEASYGAKLSFGLEKKFYDKNDIETTLKCKTEYSVTASVTVYISLSYQYIDFSLKQTQSISVSFNGKISQEWGLGSLVIPMLEAVVYLKLELKLVLSISGEITIKTTNSNKIGFTYDSNFGLQDTSTQPGPKQPENTNEVSGKIYIGLKASIKLVIIGENVIQAYLSGEVGLELSLKECIADDDDSSKHDCLICFEGDLSVKVEVKVGLKVLYQFITPETTLISVTPKICDAYYSAHYNEFGFTTCPHKSYKLTVNVVDSNGEAVDAAVKITDKFTGDTLKFKDGAINSIGSELLATTEGETEVFLPNGEYTVTLSYNSETKTKDVTVHEKATNTKFEVTSGETVTGPTEADGEIVASGTCGEDVRWALYESGLLYISGTGDMEDYLSAAYSPWYSVRGTITTIVIECGITSIGRCAFCRCKTLTSVAIPDGVTSIGYTAFEECTSLTSITIPDSVTSIGIYAFSGCKSLEKVTIPDSVTSIGGMAFYGCTSLESITIPDSVTSIGSSVFSGCTSLESITVDENNETYYSTDGVLLNKAETTLICYPNGKTATSYSIPDSVTSIGDYAFSDCTSLESITIPDSVTSIGSSVFSGCTSLESITVDENNETYYSTDGVLFNKAETTLICYPNGKTATSYSIPDSVTSIGDYAFSDCKSLEKVTIPDSVTSIGGYAFCGCKSLESITIPDSVTSIGACAFFGCTALTSIMIPDSVTSIYGSAFSNCSLLTDVYYTGTEEQWGDISISSYNTPLTSANIHYNYVPTTTVTLDEAAGPAEETPPKEIIEEVSAETTEEVTTEEAIEETTTEETTTEETTTEETVTEETTTYEADEIELLAAYTGTTDGNTASFDGLVPNERYVLLVVKDAAADDILAPENLLYIVQGVSGETGALNFRYTPREDAADAAAVVYGAAGTPVSEAKITIGVTVGGDVVVTAIANGITLVENEDYTFTATEADGMISVTVTGCGDYIGTVTVTLDHTPGDMNGKDGVTILDVLALLKSVAGITEELPFGDVNNDGKTDILDVLALLKYVAGIDGSVVY